ncbi:MAG: SDR family NAD(P)-dependent oxidoreductase [Lamprobacter sp.]|uniref:SDR family oxidoreductase n=1 Tax=Lamprobacter sp. TaxID=3100796 RepID=UPI002B25E44B|nr:SDR family NAD(P)-dependent oxidoreductase [Lamprobacter sp.]MEA3640562.1 SDR family NAD(P)-dependent oxidoreductase [Lamprobacter sp.]
MIHLNNNDLTDKVALITGASRGLGAGLAERFLEQGLRVAVCARTRPELAGDGAKILSIAADVIDAEAMQQFCDAAVDRFGHIDLWINNAGLLAPIGPLRDNNPAEFARHIQVNVVGVFNGSRAFIRHLHARGGEGVLLNISSGAARNAYAGWSAYCAGKAAVDRMSESIALEEADSGLRVHAVAPGIIDTDMQALIRDCSPEQFPRVQKFLDLKANEGFSSPAFIADRLLELAFDPSAVDESVAISLPLEKA